MRYEVTISPTGASRSFSLIVDPADLKVHDTSWMRRFRGDLRTLDVEGLWRAAGLDIVPRDDGVEAQRGPESRPTIGKESHG